MHSFARRVGERLKASGVDDAELVSSSPDSSNFGNAEALFRVGPLLVHFVKDRGQELVDIASISMPDRSFLFEDLEIAMGWKTIDQVLARQEPEELDALLERFARHLANLAEAFSGERERFTRARIERAARERGQAFMNRLQGKN